MKYWRLWHAVCCYLGSDVPVIQEAAENRISPVHVMLSFKKFGTYLIHVWIYPWSLYTCVSLVSSGWVLELLLDLTTKLGFSRYRKLVLFSVDITCYYVFNSELHGDVMNHWINNGYQIRAIESLIM